VQVNALPTGASQSQGVNATGGRTAGTVNMDNEAQLAVSATVAALANKQLKSTLSLTDLVKQLSVAVPANTTFLQITCKASSPVGAEQCANDFGSAYLSNRLTTAVTALDHTQTVINVKITRLSAEIRSLKSQLASLALKSPSRSGINVSLSADNVSLRALENQLNALLPTFAQLTPTAVGVIASPASAPTKASSPRLLLLLPSGLLGGLVIGLLVAFAVNRRDKRVHDSREVERFLGLPVLLDASSRNAGLERALAIPTSRAGQAFAQLAQSVATSFGDDDTVLLIAGTSPGAGSSVVAANLATTLARARAEVVLVCASLAGSRTTELLMTGDGPGLAEVLAGTAHLNEVARQPGTMSRLRVIGPGRVASSALMEPQHEAAERLVAELRSEARYVVIEAQSIGEDAATFTMSEFADGVIVAIEADGTRRPDALACIHDLQRMRIPILGAAVIPKIRRRRPESGSAVAATEPATSPAAAKEAHEPPVEGSAEQRQLQENAALSSVSAQGTPAYGNGAALHARGDTSSQAPTTAAPRPDRS
jgi:Mrp family chromosome partitioning ATPase/capsular polysaccharide biosynthesis protein